MAVATTNCVNRISHQNGLGWALCWVNEWRARSRWRRSLTRFSERDLDDLGLLPVQARRESRKPFWLA